MDRWHVSSSKRHDPKLREELRRITREYGKLKERWYLGGGKEPPNEKSPGLSSVVRLDKRESRDTRPAVKAQRASRLFDRASNRGPYYVGIGPTY